VGAAVILQLVQPGDLEPGAQLEVSTPVAGFLERMVYINVLLAVFNMLPVPPLDGGNVLSGLLRGSAAEAFDRVRPYGFLILYALILTDVLWTILGPPASLLLTWLL
jgi:Zn-dependent protease